MPADPQDKTATTMPYRKLLPGELHKRVVAWRDGRCVGAYPCGTFDVECHANCDWPQVHWCYRKRELEKERPNGR